MHSAHPCLARIVALVALLVTFGSAKAVPYFEAQFQQTDWTGSLHVTLWDAPTDLQYWTVRVDGNNLGSVFYWDFNTNTRTVNLPASGQAPGAFDFEREIDLSGDWFFAPGMHTLTVAMGQPGNNWNVLGQQFQYEIVLPDGPRPGVPDGGNTALFLAASVALAAYVQRRR